MATLQFPDIVGRYQQGLAFGTERANQQRAQQNQSRLSELAQTAYSAPDAASRDASIGEAIGIDREAGFGLQTNLQGIQDRKQKALVQSAAFLGRLPPEQQQSAYTGLRGRLSQEFPDLQLPEAWEQAAPTVAAINQAYGGQQADVKVVGNALVDSSGRVVYQAPQRFQTEQGLIEVGPDGAREIRLGQPQAQIDPIGPVQQGTGFTIDPSIPPQVAAQIQAQEAQAGGVQMGAPAPQAVAGGTRILPTGAGARAEQLRLAQEANQRAAEAAQRAQQAFDNAQRGNAPAGFRFRPDNTLEPIPGGPKPAGATATEGERKAATLLSRLNFSEQQLRDAVQQSPSAASPSVLAEGVRRIPFIGGDTSANVVSSPERQRVEAAQLDILDAALTLGTGAAYTKEQLEGYRRSYFPQLGDSQATIDDKAARLQNVIDAAKIAAGRAAPQAGELAPQGRNAPPVGTVRGGYRFRGGNPADQNSWEEVR